jgi:hypothetical protein
MAVERRQVILAAVAVIVLGLAAWTLWPASSPPAPTRATATQGRARTGRASTTAAEQGPVDAVRLEALTASRNGPGDAQRNPFRFRPRVVAPRELPPPPPVTETPPKPVYTGPAPPPPPAPIPLKFLGVLERANGVKWAVLTDGKSPTPLYGRDGDIIDGRYLIVKIGAESIEMTHTNGQGRQVIRLTGQ